MTIPKMEAAIAHERRDADQTLAKYEEMNTDGAGITSTAGMHVRDALLAVFILPVLLISWLVGQLVAWLVVWPFSKIRCLLRK